MKGTRSSSRQGPKAKTQGLGAVQACARRRLAGAGGSAYCRGWDQARGVTSRGGGRQAAAIVRGLTEYFTSDVAGLIERDADRDGWVLTDSGNVAGFAAAGRRPPGGAEILWIAVDPGLARPKTGNGAPEPRWASWPPPGQCGRGPDPGPLGRHPPYDATRAFWEHNGSSTSTPPTRSPGGHRATLRPSMFRPLGRRNNQRPMTSSARP